MNPSIDFHAFAPEIILTGTIVVLLLVDLLTKRKDLIRGSPASACSQR